MSHNELFVLFEGSSTVETSPPRIHSRAGVQSGGYVDFMIPHWTGPGSATGSATRIQNPRSQS